MLKAVIVKEGNTQNQLDNVIKEIKMLRKNEKERLQIETL